MVKPKSDDVIFAERLAKILWEEFDRDKWGDIDPYLFRYLADHDTLLDDDTLSDIEYLRNTLERVCERLRRPLE